MDEARDASFSLQWIICLMTTFSISTMINSLLVSSSKCSLFWPMEAVRLQDTTHSLHLNYLTRSSKMSARRSDSNLADRWVSRAERLFPRMSMSSGNISPRERKMWVLDAIWVANAQSGITLGSACTICSTESLMYTLWKQSLIFTTRQALLQVARRNQSISFHGGIIS